MKVLLLITVVVISMAFISGCACIGSLGCKSAPVTGLSITNVRQIDNDSLRLSAGGQTFTLSQRQIAEFVYSTSVAGSPLLRELPDRIQGEKRYVVYCRDQEQMHRYFPFKI
jgi:hypothetical protein